MNVYVRVMEMVSNQDRHKCKPILGTSLARIQTRLDRAPPETPCLDNEIACTAQEQLCEQNYAFFPEEHISFGKDIKMSCTTFSSLPPWRKNDL